MRGRAAIAAAGFTLLFEADWIERHAPVSVPRIPAPWRRLTRPEELARWEAAWRGEGPALDLFRPELLDDPGVAVIADDGMQAGAVLYQAAGVVGLTNFFARRGAGPTAWSSGLATAAAVFPDSTIVGYAAGRELQMALASGFALAGPLRVWSS